VLERLLGCLRQERLEGGEVDALLQDVLQGARGLLLDLVVAVAVDNRQERRENVGVGDVLGVLRCVASDVAQGPRGGRLDGVEGLVLERVGERPLSLMAASASFSRVVRDAPEGHDARGGDARERDVGLLDAEHKHRHGTAPASTTACASSALWRAM